MQIVLHIGSTGFSTKVQRQFSGEKIVFTANVVGIIVCAYEKQTKNPLTSTTARSAKSETIRLLEKKT